MKTTFTYWKDGEHFIGHLVDLYKDLSSDVVPGVRRHAELVIA